MVLMYRKICFKKSYRERELELERERERELTFYHINENHIVHDKVHLNKLFKKKNKIIIFRKCKCKCKCKGKG